MKDTEYNRFKQHDFSDAKRATDVDHLNRLRAGKTRVTIYVDDDVLEGFREHADASGIGCQTLMSQALRQSVGKVKQPLDEDILRRVLQEELRAAR